MYIDREITKFEKEKGPLIHLNLTFKSLFTEKLLYRPLLCAVFVQFSQQFSGINAVQ